MKNERAFAFIRAAALALGVVVVLVVLLPLFAGPAANLGPRELPVGVAGPGAAQFAARLDPKAFKVTTVSDPDAALREREVYGVFVVEQGGITLRTASAASPTVAALLTQVAQGARGQVVDVVPTPAKDPRGSGFAAGFFPLVLAAMLGAVALYSRVSGMLPRMAGLLTFAVLAGAAGATVLQAWLGVVGGDWLPMAGGIALLVLAVSGTVLGLANLLGTAGVGVGAILVLLVGNALAGVAAAPELFPQPWGDVGQWLPMGAGATALRSIAWFDGAGGAGALWTVAAWAAFGLAALAVPRKRPAVSTVSEPALA
ncbi:ABC transporter permease [Allorhizocola rhizosphaerae]|uniref:ABC transporter permease n=1 Tax=Allorhizocola rhizosphaerae TaxID=1872709 RepID=UPI000E3BB688|nr:ABC transporter permease [Allorhizocola rhizosphaerae]